MIEILMYAVVGIYVAMCAYFTIQHLIDTWRWRRRAAATSQKNAPSSK